MRLKSAAELARPRTSATRMANVARVASQIAAAQRENKESENRLRTLLYNLWTMNVLVNRASVPSWVARGHSTFEELVRSLGVSPEFARKALVVQREFFETGGSFMGFNNRLAQGVLKMYQVSRVARGAREANEWLQVAATCTLEELYRLVDSELNSRNGRISQKLTVAMHLSQEDARDYLNFSRDSTAVHGPEGVNVRIMRAIRYYTAHELSRRRIRAA